VKTDARFLIFDTARGPAALVGGRAGIREVVLPGLARAALRREVVRRHPDAEEDGTGLRQAAAAVRRFFETGRLTGRPPRLDLEGVGDFRRRVYEALREVPRGGTVTYGELARRIGRPGAHRSVGTAVSRNPVPLFVPCHRVVRSDGSLAGFTPEGGVELKRAMLELEGALPPVAG